MRWGYGDAVGAGIFPRPEALFDAVGWAHQAARIDPFVGDSRDRFFLVPGDPTADIKAIKSIALVSRGGTVYFPSEIYPEFGITPFTDVPGVTGSN